MLYKGPQPKSGIDINGKDALEYRPEDVRSVINNDETGILRAVFESKLSDSDDENSIEIPENYAEHAGRPSLTEMPYMTSENDGYPFIRGHSPECTGERYYGYECECKYNKWNNKRPDYRRKAWPGGPDLDDLD